MIKESAPSAPATIQLRDAQLDDYIGIKNLCINNGLLLPDEKIWRRRWEQNPLILEGNVSWSVGWVLETCDGKIVGYCGNIPMAYRLEDRNITAATTTALAVDPSYRSHSLPLLQRFFKQNHVDLFMVSSANESSGKIYKAYGMKITPSPSYEQALFWVTDPIPFFQAMWYHKGWWLPKIFGWMAGRIFKIWSAILFFKIQSKKTKCKTVYSYDERFDFFWANHLFLKKRLAFVRDQKNLTWHFQHFLDTGMGWVAIYEQDGEILGYAIFIRRDKSEIGLSRLQLADIQAINDSPDIIRELFIYGLQQARIQGGHVLEVIGFNQNKRKIFNEFSPMVRLITSHPYLYKLANHNKNMAQDMNDINVWDPSIIDGDAGL
ncbi:MAG: hypothetical protein H7839_05075 [Magnetococcus sp. YQC-5]